MSAARNVGKLPTQPPCSQVRTLVSTCISYLLLCNSITGLRWHSFIISVSMSHVGMACRAPCSASHRLPCRRQPGPRSHLEPEAHFQAYSGRWQNSIPCMVGLRAWFLGWLSARDHSQGLTPSTAPSPHRGLLLLQGRQEISLGKVRYLF